MKTIVAGSRGIRNSLLVSNAIAESGFEVTELVSGGALGVDILGELWAKARNIPIKQFLPDWDKYGKSAGHVRNKKMADYAQSLVAVWDGKSKGTKGMIEYATKKGLKVFVKTVDVIKRPSF